ncbi:MAG: response regulator [Acidobacteriota bacterium]
MLRSIAVDFQGRPFGGWTDWRKEDVHDKLAEVQRSGIWRVETTAETWKFCGPVMDASGEIHGAVAFEYSNADLRRDLRRTAGAAVATALAATLAGCLIGLALARRGTRPFQQLVASVREIGKQRFHTPVHISSFVELRQLAEAIDRMASELERTTVSLEEAEEARQEAERANQLKSRFLANLSHEVRTPLHAIVGHADLLRRDGVDASQADRLDGIQVAAGALLRLIEDVLDLALIESGNLEIADEQLDLALLVQEVIELNNFRSDPGTLDLFGLVSPGLQRMRRGDVQRLRQVLGNLVSNALKFTGSGHVVLEVHAGDRDRVRFMIHDTGRGIPESEIEAIFQPFARLISDSARISGSGLGLAISRQLALAMNGDLQLISIEGEGTQAKFEVPLPISEEGQHEGDRPVPLAKLRPYGFPPSVAEQLSSWAEANPDAPTTALIYLEGCEPSEVAATAADSEQVLVFSPSGQAWPEDKPVDVMRRPVTTLTIEEALARAAPLPADEPEVSSDLEILIVEDNLINQLVLTSMLEKLGCRVRTAADGQEGVEAWRNHRPALILMDCSMPVLDGFEATRQIRREEQQNRNGRVPILAVTAHTTREDRLRSEQAGMDDFLTKPLALETLTEALATWCGSSDVRPADR